MVSEFKEFTLVIEILDTIAEVVCVLVRAQLALADNCIQFPHPVLTHEGRESCIDSTGPGRQAGEAMWCSPAQVSWCGKKAFAFLLGAKH